MEPKRPLIALLAASAVALLPVAAAAAPVALPAPLAQMLSALDDDGADALVPVKGEAKKKKGGKKHDDDRDDRDDDRGDDRGEGDDD